MFTSERVALDGFTSNAEMLPLGKRIFDVKPELTIGFVKPIWMLIDFSKQDPGNVTNYLGLQSDRFNQWTAVLLEEGEPIIALVDELLPLNLTQTRLVNLRPEGGVGVIKSSGQIESKIEPLPRAGKYSLVFPYRPDATPFYMAKISNGKVPGFKYLISTAQ